MPRGLNRTDLNTTGISYRNGTPITEPHDFGNDILEPHDFGNDVDWQTPDPAHFGNDVTWEPSPSHFGNVIRPPYPAPTFTSTSPNNGPTSGGTSIEIVGSGFSAPGLEVLIGGNPCTSVSDIDDEHLTCVTPSGTAGETDIEIITQGGSVDTPDAWTYDVPAIALVDHTITAGNSFNSPGITTPAINSTGASLLFVVANGYNLIGEQNSIAVTDSNLNTWFPVYNGNSAPHPGMLAFYCVNPVVGSGHTVTVVAGDEGAGGYVAFSAWSSTHNLIPLAQNNQSGSSNISTPFQGGSVAAQNAGDLILSFVAGYNGFSGSTGLPATVDTGFTVLDSEFSTTPAEGGGVGGLAVGYLIAANTTAVNPTWTMQAPVTSAMIENVVFARVATDSIRLVASTNEAAGGYPTTPAINTTGANFLVAMVSQYSPSGAPQGLTDTYGNTWTLVPWNNTVDNGKPALYFAYDATVGTGHTFTMVGSDGGIAVMAFSGVQSGSNPFESGVDSVASSSETTQPGSVTPNSAGDLIIGCFVSVFNTIPTSVQISLNEGLIGLPWPAVNSEDACGVLSYAIAGGTSPVNPTWTFIYGGSAPSKVFANAAVFAHA